MLFATRLNAFKSSPPAGKNRITTVDLLERAARVDGLNAADLNYPDHFETSTAGELVSALDRLHMTLNGLAMRYYSDPRFGTGAFTHPDSQVRRAAIDMTRRGIDTVLEMGGNLITLWLGQDGFDTSFQVDYDRLWDDTVGALQAVADHEPSVDIAIEYKPNEPRAFASLPDLASTLLALAQAGADNLGVTLDFAHVLYADEMPAQSVAMVNRHSRLLGVHLNDGYGKRDDGLMVASVHPVQTVELLVELQRCRYERAIYFDTFPDHSGLDPVNEAAANIEAMRHLVPVAERLSNHSGLRQAIAGQDAATSMRIVNAALYGGNAG